MHLRKVRASKPLDRQLGQLFQRPVVLCVRSLEFIHIEIGPHGRGVDVQASGQKVFPLLWIVLGLQGIVHNVRRPDGHVVARVCLLLLLCRCEIHVSVFVLVRPGDEHEIRIILHLPAHHLGAILKALITETIGIVARCRDADHQLVGVRLHGLFESVVLSRLFEDMQLICNGNIAV